MRPTFRLLISLVFLGLFLVSACAVNAQVASQRPRKIRPEEDLAAGAVDDRPKDEILFTEYDLQESRLRPGWRLIALSERSADNRITEVYYDHSRLSKSRDKTVISGWLKYVEEQDYVEQSTTMVLHEFGCMNRQLRVVESVKYDKKKEGPTSTQGTQWYRIVPDSTGETMYQVICKGAMDWEEKIMRQADAEFQFARKNEKQGLYDVARHWYQEALKLADNNRKILAALGRLEKK